MKALLQVGAGVQAGSSQLCPATAGHVIPPKLNSQEQLEEKKRFPTEPVSIYSMPGIRRGLPALRSGHVVKEPSCPHRQLEFE